MKFTKHIIGLALALVLNVSAAPIPYDAFVTGGSAIGSVSQVAIIPCLSVNAKTPVVTYLNVTGDASAVKALFYVATNAATVLTNGGLGGLTNLLVASTNGFTITSAGQPCVIRHKATDTYEFCVVGNATNSVTTNQFGESCSSISINKQTNYTLATSVALGTSAAYGDTIYSMALTQTIPIGSATKELQGPGIFYGNTSGALPASPCLITAGFAQASTSTGTLINAVGGHFSLLTP
jgi:hypothetical protein